MLSLKQSMFRPAPEKHCLGRSHHSCSFSTKFAICYCYVNISNSRREGKKKPHQPDNKKHQAKPYILTLKTKPNQKPLLAFAKTPPPLLTTPVLSFSFPLYLTSGMEAVCPMEDPECFAKANQSHPAWIPTISTNPLLVCAKLFSWWEGRWCKRKESKSSREDTGKWNCTLNSLHKIEH